MSEKNFTVRGPLAWLVVVAVVLVGSWGVCVGLLLLMMALSWLAEAVGL